MSGTESDIASTGGRCISTEPPGKDGWSLPAKFCLIDGGLRKRAAPEMPQGAFYGILTLLRRICSRHLCRVIPSALFLHAAQRDSFRGDHR